MSWGRRPAWRFHRVVEVNLILFEVRLRDMELEERIWGITPIWYDAFLFCSFRNALCVKCGVEIWLEKLLMGNTSLLFTFRAMRMKDVRNIFSPLSNTR